MHPRHAHGLRFRMNPELHISDNLRILSEIDALDNVVLGSTPNAYANTVSGGSYAPAGYSGFAPLGFNTTTQGPPTAGVNGTQNSINVKRAWAEYMTPVRRAPLEAACPTSGASEWCTTPRRRNRLRLAIEFHRPDHVRKWHQVDGPLLRRLPGLHLQRPDEPDASTTIYGGQPYNTCQLCNVAQYSAFVAHRTNPELQRLQISRGDFVLNGGVYLEATGRSGSIRS